VRVDARLKERVETLMFLSHPLPQLCDISRKISRFDSRL